VDHFGCGTVRSPCASLAYAVANVANGVVPPSHVVTVVLGPGVFGPSSCGALALRPMRVTGAGSRATLVDCAGQARMLATNDTLTLSGLTITRGVVDVGTDPSIAGGVPLAFGGGAVAVAWPSNLVHASALFVDVAIANCSVVGQAFAGVPSLPMYIGGGGVLVTGGGNGSWVMFKDCTLAYNSVSAVAGPSNPLPSIAGGGACVVLGLAPGGFALWDASITVDGLVATGNSLARCANSYGELVHFRVPFIDLVPAMRLHCGVVLQLGCCMGRCCSWGAVSPSVWFFLGNLMQCVALCVVLSRGSLQRVVLCVVLSRGEQLQCVVLCVVL
jgi:hypothetical protein